MDVNVNNPLPTWAYAPIMAVALYFLIQVGNMIFRIALNAITSKKTVPDVGDCPYKCGFVQESKAQTQRISDTMLNKYTHQEEHAAERKERKSDLDIFFKEMNEWKVTVTERLHGMELAFTAAGIKVKKN